MPQSSGFPRIDRKTSPSRRLRYVAKQREDRFSLVGYTLDRIGDMRVVDGHNGDGIAFFCHRFEPCRDRPRHQLLAKIHHRLAVDLFRVDCRPHKFPTQSGIEIVFPLLQKKAEAPRRRFDHPALQ